MNWRKDDQGWAVGVGYIRRGYLQSGPYLQLGRWRIYMQGFGYRQGWSKQYIDPALGFWVRVYSPAKRHSTNNPPNWTWRGWRVWYGRFPDVVLPSRLKDDPPATRFSANFDRKNRPSDLIRG